MLELRKVNKEDCDLLFQWANDPDCRKNSFSGEMIDYNTHVKWFENKLKSKENDLFVAQENKTPVGMLRLDYHQKTAVISYSVAKEERKKGYGKQILQLAENYVQNNKDTIDELLGEVKKDNIISMHRFEQLGYIKIDKRYYIEYRKKVKVQKHI